MKNLRGAVYTTRHQAHCGPILLQGDRRYRVWSWLLGILALTQVFSVGMIDAQGGTIEPPIGALWSDGSTVLIGRDSTLIEAILTPDLISTGRSVDLRQGAIRDIARSGTFTLVLSENGLSSLDATLTPQGFLPGGGQRLAVGANGQIYIAALSGGARLIRMAENGNLTRIATLETPGPALAVAVDPELPTRLWVACGASGVRSYEIADLAKPQLIASLDSYAPATALTVIGSRLYIGHGGALSILDNGDPTEPRLLSTTALDETPVPKPGQSTPDPGYSQRVTVNDLSVIGNRIAVARSCLDCLPPGADVVLLNASADGVAQVTARLGESGAGERLAFRGDEIIISSERLGLQRISLGRGQPFLIATWQALTPPPFATPSPDASTESAGTPPVWMATPVPLPREGQIYRPPLVQVNPQSPEAALLLICGTMCAGIIVIIAGAWLISMVGQRLRS